MEKLFSSEDDDVVFCDCGEIGDESTPPISSQKYFMGDGKFLFDN